MLARIHKAMRNRDEDQGFTLIELLVVMIIIGILAAIAIPVFLNQRKKAVDASIKSDLRTIAAEMETYYTDNQAYIFTTASSATVTSVTIVSGTDVKVSSGNVISAKPLATATTLTTASAWNLAVGYCLTGTNPKGSTTTGFTYNSLSGGLSTTACP
jgi:type IV pilus assembly protein PilA